MLLLHVLVGAGWCRAHATIRRLRSAGLLLHTGRCSHGGVGWQSARQRASAKHTGRTQTTGANTVHGSSFQGADLCLEGLCLQGILAAKCQCLLLQQGALFRKKRERKQVLMTNRRIRYLPPPPHPHRHATSHTQAHLILEALAVQLDRSNAGSGVGLQRTQAVLQCSVLLHRSIQKTQTRISHNCHTSPHDNTNYKYNTREYTTRSRGVK